MSRPIPLRAGPLTLIFDGGDLRTIRLGQREVVRRLYVAVRDHNWDTIVPTLHDLTIEQHPASFSIRFRCQHRQGPVAFDWTGTISGDEQGRIAFTMDGQAAATFRRNRIGFCLLHPPHECAGQPFIAVKADGRVAHGHFPVFIAPHQPVFDLTAISHPVWPDCWAELAFSGDIFEMEDQRNWTDASYKTYCTPLALPFPVEVAAGTVVQQSVTLTLHGTPPAAAAAPAGDSVTLTLATPLTTTLPAIGLGQASHGQALSETEIDRLRALRPAHLRVDLALAEPAYPAQLATAAATAAALGAGLEVALFLSDDAVAELSGLLRHLAQQRPTIARWLIFHRDQKSTGTAWVRLARQRLSEYDPAAPIGAGTNAYFTELNRDRPPVELLDCVAYSINPQVHAFDALSLVENLAGQAETVISARAFCGSRPLIISPVTLRPRFNPNATAAESPATASPAAGLPASVDARQPTLFAAAWTLGSLKYLAESGVAAVTYYETTGWRGVLEQPTGPPRPDLFPSRPGAVFPLYHVLADVAELAGARVSPVQSSDPLRAAALALTDAGRTLLLVANLTDQEQTLTVSGLAGPVHCRLLDETTLERATTDPSSFRADPGPLQRPVNGRLHLTMRPYAVARLASGLNA